MAYSWCLVSLLGFFFQPEGVSLSGSLFVLVCCLVFLKFSLALVGDSLVGVHLQLGGVCKGVCGSGGCFFGGSSSGYGA